MIITNSPDIPNPVFRVLSEEQCQRLVEATLDCMARTGVQVHNPAARQLMSDHGASVEQGIVRFPAELVREAIRTTPSEFTVWGREGTQPMRVALDRVHFGPGPTCTYFVDPVDGRRRHAQRGDAGSTARLCDALPNMDFVMGLCLLDDVTPGLASVYEFAEELENTTKPIVAWADSVEALQDIHSMAVAAAGGEDALRQNPIFAYFATYESPLRLADMPLATMLWAARHGIPVVCLGGPTVGLESPFTGAAALVLHLASALAALTVVQAQTPGAAMAIGGLPSMMDLRTARPAYGSPEASLFTAAAVDLARYLELPFMGTAGASEAKTVDAQAGAEAALQVVLSALSGAALVHDAGFLDCADIGSLAYLVLVDEIIGMVKRAMRGIHVSPDTLMLDLIDAVGPGGQFLNQPQSASLCRAEAWVPRVLDRNPYAVWEKKGGPALEETLSMTVRTILEAHQPEPLRPDVKATIEQILRHAETRHRPG